jgi:hypothetical protein
MGILFGNKERKASVEEQFVQDLNAVVAQASPEEIEEFANWVFEYIPILVAQANRPTSPFMERIKLTVLKKGKKLLWRALSPVECVQAILAAVEKFAPDIQRIFVEQCQRYQRAREQLRQLEQAPTPRLLEPVQP